MEMVREARSLKSLDELSLSDEAKAYLLVNYRSFNKPVWEGRRVAYINAESPETVEKTPVLFRELGQALDEAGFIRHDITSGSFSINHLYRDVYPSSIFGAMFIPCSFDDLARKEQYMTSAVFGNENYENFQNPSAEQIKVVKEVLKSELDDEGYEVFMYYYGFDGKAHSEGQTAKYFGRKGGSTWTFEYIGTRRSKLWSKKVLPPIFESTDEQRRELYTLIRQIRALHQDPVFKKEAELKKKLRAISKMPFDYAEDAERGLRDEAQDYTDIGQLDLDTHTLRILRQIGADTVADVVSMRKKDLLKFRGMGERGLEKVENEICKLGYDFRF